MKTVQIVFNIQVPDHITEEEVNARLHQVIGSVLDQEFGLSKKGQESFFSPLEDHDTPIGNA